MVRDMLIYALSLDTNLDPAAHPKPSAEPAVNPVLEHAPLPQVAAPRRQVAAPRRQVPLRLFLRTGDVDGTMVVLPVRILLMATAAVNMVGVAERMLIVDAIVNQITETVLPVPHLTLPLPLPLPLPHP